MYGNIPISQEGANILHRSISFPKEKEKNIQIKKKKCVYIWLCNLQFF